MVKELHKLFSRRSTNMNLISKACECTFYYKTCNFNHFFTSGNWYVYVEVNCSDTYYKSLARNYN